MSISAKAILFALLVVPLAAAAETESKPDVAGIQLHANAKAAASHASQVRCRLYFGCAPVARAARDAAHPMPEQ